MKNPRAFIIGLGSLALVGILGFVANTSATRSQTSYEPSTEVIEPSESTSSTSELEDSLTEEKAALETERLRLEQLADEQEVKRQQEESARLAASKALKDNTSQAWVDYVNVLLRLDSRSTDTNDMPTLVSAFRSAVYEIDDISTANIDPELEELIYDSRNNLAGFHKIADTYHKQVTELENTPAADAVDACINAVTTQETDSFWEGTWSCLGNGLVNGTVSSYRSSEALKQLETNSSIEVNALLEQQDKLLSRTSDMTEYLESEYDITLTFN